MAKILMVTPFPPQPDGIASYALQMVRRLRAEGHTTEVLSPGPSAAHHHLDLRRPRGALALAKRVRSYDRVVIQFHPDFFYDQPLTPKSITRQTLALCVAVSLARAVEMRVHELDYRWGRGRTLMGWANRRLWRRATSISVHTARERDDLIASFGVRPDRVTLVEHGSDFVASTSLDQRQARASLDLPEGITTFLSIGFIQRHKGFDRAVRAFRQLGVEDRARLDIVGGVRVEDPDNLAYLHELEELVASVPGAHLHVGFLSDEAFDRWIVASDVVVLPYREIWSSGVLERALLLERPVVVTEVGGLPDQARGRPEIRLVRDDAGLASAMGRSLGDDASEEDVERQAWQVKAAPRATIQESVRARAALHRGYSDPLPDGLATSRHGPLGSTRPLEALHLLPGLGLASPRTDRTGGTRLKRYVQRLTGWQVDPVVHHVNALQRATIDAVDELRRLSDSRCQPDQPDQADSSSTMRP